MNYKKILSVFLILSFVSLNGLGAFAQAVQEPVQLQPVNMQTPSCACDNPKIEHMPKQKNIYLNTVKVMNGKAVIAQGNILKIKFAQDFSSKTAKAGDKVIFVLDEDLCTQECTKLLPKGTQIVATVQCVEPPMWWNKHAKVLLSIGTIKLPNGQCGTLCARVFSKDSTLKKSGWATFGKISGYTVGLFGVGAGIGAAIGAAADAVGIGCLAIGMPVGGGIGLILGVVTPGMHYKAKPGKTIKIQLTQDLEICLSKI